MKKPAGLAPGSLVYTGLHTDVALGSSLIRYTESEFQEQADSVSIESIEAGRDDEVLWLNVDGLHDVDRIALIGQRFGIHTLTLEDVVNTGQRPKLEEMDHSIFISCQMLHWDKKEGKIDSELISLVIQKGWVISFQEKPGDVFDPVRERIRIGKGRIRIGGADYLGYALLDTVVDHYLILLSTLSERIERLEQQAVGSAPDDLPRKIQKMLRQLSRVRNAVTPMRDAVDDLLMEETDVFDEVTIRYMSDVREHLAQAADRVEAQRDALKSVMDAYLSTIGMRTNEIMKVLTLLATIFLPLTFIAGVYGMNFANMPELRSRWGYPAVLSVMGLVGVAMLLYFKRKRWI